jgi:hypothetical protein
VGLDGYEEMDVADEVDGVADYAFKFVLGDEESTVDEGS